MANIRVIHLKNKRIFRGVVEKELEIAKRTRGSLFEN